MFDQSLTFLSFGRMIRGGGSHCSAAIELYISAAVTGSSQDSATYQKFKLQQLDRC